MMPVKCVKVTENIRIILVAKVNIWPLPTQLIIFPHFWAKIWQIAHPVNYSYLPPLAENPFAYDTYNHD